MTSPVTKERVEASRATLLRYVSIANGKAMVPVLPKDLREAADILSQLMEENGRMRDALIDWRTSWLCPATDFDEQVSRLLTNTDAAIGEDKWGFRDDSFLGVSPLSSRDIDL